MNFFDFETLENIGDIANKLGYQPNFIESVLDYPDTFYSQLQIKRKRHQYPRIVYEVDDLLKTLYKNILVSITAKVDFPEYVQGFLPKRSIVTNASLHLGRKYVLNLDIKDFFFSIKIKKVVCAFKLLGCNDEVASILAQLCTLNETLVPGVSTSPILANLICVELDKELLEIGERYECAYSRYADDITFSGEKVPKKRKLSVVLKSIISKLTAKNGSVRAEVNLST